MQQLPTTLVQCSAVLAFRQGTFPQHDLHVQNLEAEEQPHAVSGPPQQLGIPSCEMVAEAGRQSLFS